MPEHIVDWCGRTVYKYTIDEEGRAVEANEFKEAIAKMREDGEFRRIEKWYEEHGEERKARHVHNLCAMLKDARETPFPELLVAVDDAMVLQSAIGYMVSYEL